MFLKCFICCKINKHKVFISTLLVENNGKRKMNEESELEQCASCWKFTNMEKNVPIHLREAIVKAQLENMDK